MKIGQIVYVCDSDGKYKGIIKDIMQTAGRAGRKEYYVEFAEGGATWAMIDELEEINEME